MAPSPSTDPGSRGSCAGFEVHSSLPFETLRAGGGTPLLVEERGGPAPEGEVVANWRPRPGNPFHGRLLRDGSSFAFWASDAGWYRIDPDRPAIAMEPGDNLLRRELRLFGIPAAVCALAAGDLSLHASAVEVDGHAILFAGPTMFGKTTVAAAFAAHGHRLLAEDTIRCSPGARPVVHPGPSVVRLRADVAGSLTIADASPGPAFDEGRVPLILAPSGRGSGEPVPLAAIVFLRAGDGDPRLDANDGATAARDLFSLAFRLPTSESRASCFSQVVDLATRVETLDLRRPMTVEALPAVVDLFERRFAR